MIFYFSGTGNSKWVAEQLGEVQKERLVFIPDVLRDSTTEFSLSENEKIGFVFPVYSWGPPPIILQFIRNLTLLNYKSHYLFFVCSCGDDIGLTARVLRKVLLVKGWECHAGFSITMPNNYVLLPGFDVDVEDVELRKLAEALPEMSKMNHVINEKQQVFSCHEGSMPYIKTRLINPLFTRYGISPKRFHVTSACIACRCCERICPVGNIVMVDCRPEWGMNCTSCLACYHICLQKAVQYGKQTEKKGQYFNPNVSVHDKNK